jgi:Ca2+-binding RTX toxin-like protein
MIVAVPPVGGNHVNVQSVAPGVFMNITLANGDRAVVGGPPPIIPGQRTPDGNTMAGVLGNVNFTEETAGTASITLDDSGDNSAAGQRVTIAPPPSASDPFSSIVGLSGDPTAGVFWVLNPGSTVAVHGGAGAKTFALLGAVPNVTLSIDGGPGANTLDYSGWTGDISVNLQLGTATGVDGGISNIRNVTGSIGNDLIVGDANANVLIGGTGRNVIIGGGGADQIVGGGGDNLLIGGTTAYDQNAPALALIWKEWLLPSDFGTRKTALQTGGDLLTGTGIELVTGSTVHPDGLAAITPGPGNNWTIA